MVGRQWKDSGRGRGWESSTAPSPRPWEWAIIHRPATPPLGIGNREWGIVGMGNDAAGGSGDEKNGGVRGGEVFLPDSPFPIADSHGWGCGAWRIPKGGVVGRWIIPHSQGVAETALDWPESPA